MFGVLSIAMDDDTRSPILYGFVILLCALQFFRPTILKWGLLTAGFSAYAIIVATNFSEFKESASEFVVFLLAGALPAVGLFLSWPKPKALRSEDHAPPV
jgi:hypothetical protein